MTTNDKDDISKGDGKRGEGRRTRAVYRTGGRLPTEMLTRPPTDGDQVSIK